MKRLLTIFLVVVLLTACNGSSIDLSKVSADDLTASVKENIAFVDDMLEISNEVAKDFYALPDGVVEMKVYVSSSGATAEELAIFKCKDVETADAVMKSCQKRIEALKEKYEDYIPAEMEKIEKSVVLKRDCFVMFVCANDTTPAQESFENYK